MNKGSGERRGAGEQTRYVKTIQGMGKHGLAAGLVKDMRKGLIKSRMRPKDRQIWMRQTSHTYKHVKQVV